MRLAATYRLQEAADAVEARAAAIAREQTVEVPAAQVPPGFVAEAVVARVTDIAEVDAETFDATLTFHGDQVGASLTGLLNAVFGNVALAGGLRLTGLHLPAEIEARFAGPRHGLAGLRRRLGVESGPLTCTALKPLGRSAGELAEQAYRCALGGIDVIKDDHGLLDQPWAPFAERLQRCRDAVAAANAETGRTSLYCPHITADADALYDRARTAVAEGCEALLVCPGLVGLDRLQALARDDAVAAALLAHPSHQGQVARAGSSGVDPGLALGYLPRLAGADGAIFPNYGGRFGFSAADCAHIAGACRAATPAGLAAAAPIAGGGLTLGRVGELHAMYGEGIGYLIGGGLYDAGGGDLYAGATALRRALGRPVD